MKTAARADMDKGVALFVAVLASFLTPFVGSSVSIALPSIAQEFKLDAITLGWVVTAYLLAAAVFLVPFGKLADIKGRKRIFTYGIIIDAVSSIGAALSPSGSLLIFFRLLQGVGGAMIFGTGVAIVTSIFPLAERGKALGISTAAVYIGLSVGPPASGLMTQYLGWRSIFALDALIGLIIIIAVLWRLKGEWTGVEGEKFDAAGSVVYGLALLAIMYGFTLLPDISGLAMVGLGLAGLALFIFWESRIKNPVLNMELFKRSLVFSMSNLAALINYSATYAISFLLSLYLQYIKGYSPEISGLILVLQPIIMAVLSPIAGRLSDRIQPQLIATVGMAFTTAGLAMMIFLDQDTQLYFIMISLITVGLGFGLFSSPNTNAVMSAVDKTYYGVASGTLATMRLVGQMLSVGIVMLMFAMFIGQVQIGPANYPLFIVSSKTAFIVFTVLCFAGIFASLARGKSR
ncbi:MAG: MFS transporter [Dehalococcoidia bacterium]|jgi:EmrB/QacA subfamily drug resistance transporter